ncbi:hypothetical protein C5S35_09915 [Candidatus Methanophagaceae archaeon]|nr:hypothetical protein C5S35_09915 [Methanophagales archaeon]
MSKEITLADIMDMLDEYEAVELEDVSIEGEIELELSSGGAVPTSLIQILQSMLSAVDKQIEATRSTRSSLIHVLQPKLSMGEKKVAGLAPANSDLGMRQE